jgi:uncharacterized protein with gpF-like domain
MTVAQYGSLSFQEAIDFFLAKLSIPTERWNDIWQEQHDVAFVVAGATETDLLADMRELVSESITEGRSLSWFQSNFKALVKRKGWQHTGSTAWRANIIYSTNVRQSYNAGRYSQLQTFEFWRYKHGDSLSPRPAHQARDGLILPKDSPFWRVWFPQNGWGCKCKVFGESRRSLERKGLRVSNEPVIETREWTDKVTGEVHHVPVGIDPGFDYAPGATSQAERARQQADAKPALADRIVNNI